MEDQQLEGGLLERLGDPPGRALAINRDQQWCRQPAAIRYR
jgi:hypothetical protein